MSCHISTYLRAWKTNGYLHFLQEGSKHNIMIASQPHASSEIGQNYCLQVTVSTLFEMNLVCYMIYNNGFTKSNIRFQCTGCSCGTFNPINMT